MFPDTDLPLAGRSGGVGLALGASKHLKLPLGLFSNFRFAVVPIGKPKCLYLHSK